MGGLYACLRETKMEIEQEIGKLNQKQEIEPETQILKVSNMNTKMETKTEIQIPNVSNKDTKNEKKTEADTQIPKVSDAIEDTKKNLLNNVVLQNQVSFEQTDDPTKSLQNTVAYLKGLDKVPEDWKKVEWKTETRAGIFQAICKFDLKPEALSPSAEYHGQDIEPIFTHMLAGYRWGIIIVDWPDATGYAIAIHQDLFTGRFAIFDPSSGKYFLTTFQDSKYFTSHCEAIDLGYIMIISF